VTRDENIGLGIMFAVPIASVSRPFCPILHLLQHHFQFTDNLEQGRHGSRIIGLVPGFGDIADMLLALMVYRTICSVDGGIESSAKMRMQMNIVIDFVIGLIPFIGDVADAAYKCNTRNVILFEQILRKRGEKRLRGTPQASMADPSLPDQFDYEAEEQSVAQNGPPPQYASRNQSRRDRRDQHDDRDVEAGQGIRQPVPARTRSDRY
jgi:Domain of unknown function (DUF4112)